MPPGGFVMGRPSIYTPEIHKAVVATIRAGAYDWVAAEANGIDRMTFHRWMRRGETERVEPFWTFSQDVRLARAQARASAELEVKKEQPFNWLRYGPGREREKAEGWTESKEVRHSGSIDVVHSIEWSRIATTIEQALGPYPEAKLAVANALKLLGPGSEEEVIDVVAREES